MILLKKCPVCESQNIAQKLTCKDHTSSKESFNIVSCETCSFVFTNPRPLDEKLSDYYRPGAYISHTNSSEGLFNWVYQSVRSHTIKNKVSLLKTVKASGKHLDIGCGTGEFLNACKNSGFKTRGVEPSEIARKQAIENYGLSISQSADLSQYANSEFDSISMWHALEHIPNLNGTISHLNRILKSDGKLIIAVPNHKCWDANYYNEYWAAWDVPIHLWHFAKKTIKHLFENHEFDLIKTKPMIFDSFYVSLLSEELVSGKKNFIKGLTVGFISNFFGVFTKKGHSSILYVFSKKKTGV